MLEKAGAKTFLVPMTIIFSCKKCHEFRIINLSFKTALFFIYVFIYFLSTGGQRNHL